MNSPKSKSRIKSFIDDFDIDTEKFVKTSPVYPGWNNFNEFFIRKYKDKHLNFSSASELPAFVKVDILLGKVKKRSLNLLLRDIS